ncbi:MAG: hypothetical protein ACRDHP_14810 [Ktedonobacterales bacterium]
MSGSPEDVLAQARTRLDAVRTRRSVVRAEIAGLKGGEVAVGTDHGVDQSRLEALEAEKARLGVETEAAHEALGRAILDQFERDLAKLRIPLGDPEAARELQTMAENLRRACLTVLADWPELVDEAKRRLTVRPPGPTTLQG